MHHKPTVLYLHLTLDMSSLSSWTWFQKTWLFGIWLWNTVTLVMFSTELGTCEICCQYTTDWSVRNKQLLLPLTLNQGDVIWVNHSLEQLYLTSSPSGKSTPPSRLSINKPLPSFPPFSFPSSRSGALHICEKVIISQSGAAGCHAACQPQEEKGNVLCQGKTVCFYAVLIPTQLNLLNTVPSWCLK